MSAERNEALILAECLRLGLTTVADVVRWADDQIAASDEPHPMLCEIAFAWRADPLELAAMLHEVPGGFDPPAVLQGVVAVAAEALRSQRLPPRAVAHSLECLPYLTREVGEQADRDCRALLRWADEFELAERGYLDVNDEDQIASMMQTALDTWLRGHEAST